jgi:hypothetical protein
MARKAEFSINGQSIIAELKKVDRKKIYGWSTCYFDNNPDKGNTYGKLYNYYAVIDVRTNKLITEIIHKEIDVCPKLIRVDSDTFLKY